MSTTLTQQPIIEIDEKKLLKKWDIEKDKKIILLPGRLTSWKGQEVFIRGN